MKTTIPILFLAATLHAAPGIITERVVVSQTLTTLDGRTFRDFKVVHPVADGVLIEFVPVSRGYGMATVKWADLTADAQKELGRYVRK